MAEHWQRRGVAKQLFAALADRAREEGISRWRAHVPAENPAALALVEQLGETTHEHSGPAVEVTIELPGREREAILRAIAEGTLVPARALRSALQRRAQHRAP